MVDLRYLVYVNEIQHTTLEPIRKNMTESEVLDYLYKLMDKEHSSLQDVTPQKFLFLEPALKVFNEESKDAVSYEMSPYNGFFNYRFRVVSLEVVEVDEDGEWVDTVELIENAGSLVVEKDE